MPGNPHSYVARVDLLDASELVRLPRRTLTAMSNSINPRPLFAQTIALLAEAKCPKCSKQAHTRNLNLAQPDWICDWCTARERMIEEYAAWKKQDAAATRNRVRD